MFRLLEETLKSWRIDPFRMPLLLRGARQVGKSYLVEAFGRDYFESLLVVNFDANPEYCACFQDSLEPQGILQRLELIANQPIIPGHTLLFLDEIQNCPRAIMALRYFKEKCPLLHVIGAGSLLEFALETNESFSFPVGRVQFIYVRPCSFQEYLIAQNSLHLPQLLEQTTLDNPLSQVVHEKLIGLVRQYYFIGGMPAAIATFLRTQSFLKVREMHAIISQTYQNDFGKYSKEKDSKFLKILFEKIPNLIGQQFKYSKIDPESNARELKKALHLLMQAGVMQMVHATSGVGIPFHVHQNERKFKMLFLDLGLIQGMQQVDAEKIWRENLTQINAGMLAEQFVGQELLAYGEAYEERALFFWEREERGSEAEVDYLINVGSQILPIEVKAGKEGSLRSLKLFMKERRAPLGLRISQKPLSYEEGILSIPFYLIGHIPRLVKALHLFPYEP